MRALEILFEREDTDLNPGEKREIEVKLADLKKIRDRIEQHTSFLGSLDWTTSPGAGSISRKFDTFKKEVQAKIDQLKDRLETERREFSSSNPELEALFEKIEDRCSDYLDAVGQAGRVLYRGSSRSGTAWIERSWDVRKVKDSDSREQEIFDDLLEKIGIKARRSNSVYCSPDYHQAAGYTKGTGDVYVIFPINGFHYSYTNSDDLMMSANYTAQFIGEEQMRDYMTKFTEWFQKEYPDPSKASYGVEQVATILNRFGSSTWYSVSEAFADLRYYTTGYNAGTINIPPELQLTPEKLVSMISLEKFKNDMNPRQDGLAQFLENRNGEILISGTYYALSYSKLWDAIKSRFIDPPKKDS